MAISAYQVDSVLKAYSKQSKMRLRANPQEKQMDIVSLTRSEEHSGEERSREDAYKKISYSLVDILVKDKK
ncbi:MAG: hypothetical protein FWE89_04335 [Syntrophaceae bacterium]|nr:hypothetical protein [Syntrophaceae bacterium]